VFLWCVMLRCWRVDRRQTERIWRQKRHMYIYVHSCARVYTLV